MCSFINPIASRAPLGNPNGLARRSGKPRWLYRCSDRDLSLRKKYNEMSFLELADRLAIAALPAASLTRLGNFFNSEIIGVHTTQLLLRESVEMLSLVSRLRSLRI